MQAPLCCLCASSGEEPQLVQQIQKQNGKHHRTQNATSVDFGMGIAQEILVLRAASSAPATRSKETELGRLLRERRGGEEVISLAKLDDLIVNAAGSSEEDVVALKRSIVTKRKVAGEAMVAAMQAAKFGPTYSLALVRDLTYFLDMIITKAVMLKRNPSYAHLSFSTRARFCIDQSNVVPLVRWLRHNNLTVSRIGELICFAGEHLELIRLKVEWLRRLNVRGRDLGMVLTKHPGLLIRPFNQLNHNVALLQNAGLKKEWMGLVLRFSPQVLLQSHDQLYRKIELLTELGIDEYSFGTMAFNFPAILGRVSTEDIQAKVEYLQGFGLDEHTIGKMLVTRPHLLGYSIEDSWQPITKFLYCLGIERSGMRRILSRNPSIFCLDLSINIVPKVQFLRAIGVHEEVIGQVIVDFPPFLTASLNRRIRPLVRFLLETAGVSEDKIGKVIAVQPEIIGCSLNLKLAHTVWFFLSLGIQNHQLGQMIAEFPMLIKYNEPVLRPKFLYLKRVMRRSVEEVVQFPRFFSYALESRIIPRHELLVGKGFKFRLRQMLACTDEEFGRKVEAAERRKEEVVVVEEERREEG